MSRTIDPPLRYVETAVTLAEVPREVSLTISVSNCLYRCSGCHSPYLQQDVGRPLLNDLDALIRRYEGLITCVCLMGEGQNRAQLECALRTIRAGGLKTCLYSGSADADSFGELLPLLDYLKLGPYVEALGGLDSPHTNQRFYRISAGQQIDETWMFQRKRLEDEC